MKQLLVGLFRQQPLLLQLHFTQQRRRLRHTSPLHRVTYYYYYYKITDGKNWPVYNQV